MLNRRQFLSISGASAAVLGGLALTGCSGDKPSAGSSGTATKGSGDFKVTMVTDMGGVNDQSFNQSAWEGLQELEKDTGIPVDYLESKQEGDYPTNLDKAVDNGANLVWGIGFALAGAIEQVAKTNPDVAFANIDNGFEDPASNVTGVTFRAQEGSFIVGYIAALKSETGKLGFVGGQQSVVIDQFEWGFKAGVAYANKEKGKNATVDAQYVESFTDSAKGKATATKMLSAGCDIVFHAAGGAGVGAIEAAKEAGKFAIGVDMDQAHLAPDNVLTSALKHVSKAMIEVSKEAADGKEIGGKNIEFGLAEGMVGIPEEHTLMGDEIYQAAMDIQDKITAGDITPPHDEATFEKFQASL